MTAPADSERSPSPTSERSLRVWDLPIRVVHWGLVVCLAGSWWTAENEDWERHLLFGYGALGLVVFRVAWGMVGSETARFRSFVRGPAAVLAHLRELARPGPLPAHPGHNPAGALAVLLLLLLVAVQTLSGLFLSGGDLFVVEAPLSGWLDARMTRWLEDVHEWGFTLLQGMAALHVLAVLGYAVVKRRNLIVPMLTGRDADLQGPAPFMAPLSRAIVLGALVAAGVWALVRFA